MLKTAAAYVASIGSILVTFACVDLAYSYIYVGQGLHPGAALILWIATLGAFYGGFRLIEGDIEGIQ